MQREPDNLIYMKLYIMQAEVIALSRDMEQLTICKDAVDKLVRRISIYKYTKRSKNSFVWDLGH